MEYEMLFYFYNDYQQFFYQSDQFVYKILFLKKF